MTDSTIAPEKIIINGQEIDPEEATRLIELGRGRQELESKLNTSIDKVYPEYTRAQQELTTLKREKAERDAELEKLKSEQAARVKDQETPAEDKEIRARARQLGLTDEDYLKEKGYMTKEETESLLEERERNREAGRKILDQCSDLEKEIDGSDGRVPFDTEAVLFYANGKGITDVQEAYNEMNKKGNAKWQQEQIEKEQKPGLTTLQPGGKREPQRPKYTNDNLGQALGEWLQGLPEGQ